jgi:endogenous inhibitor of DNA gyrase (YacG/DUF329 family)
MININKNALKCPNCEGEVSILQKASLISRNSYSICCKKCGKRIKLPKWANVNYVINALIFLLPPLLIKPPWAITLVFVGIYGIMTSIIVVFFIPLIRKEDYTQK